MDLYNLLFSSKKTKNNELTDASIKRMIRKTGIIYAAKNLDKQVNTMFNLIRDNTISGLNNIVEHRKGKIIQSKEMKKTERSFWSIP